jgi:hypothetical protein
MDIGRTEWTPLLLDIGLFVLFLIGYAGFLFASFKIGNYARRDPERANSLWFQQVTIVLFLALVAFALLLLARVFSVSFLVLLLIASELGAVVLMILRLIFGSGISRTWFYGFEWGVKHPVVALALSVLATLFFFAYPVATAIAYFKFPIPSVDLTFWILALTAGLVFASVAYITVFAIGVMLSEAVDDETRTHTFVRQMTTVVLPAVWLAVVLSASRVGESGTVDVAGASFTASLPVLGFLIAFVFVTAFLPYVVGAWRARRARILLLRRERDWLEKLAEVLEVPASPGFADRLEEIRDRAEREEAAFVGAHPILDRESLDAIADVPDEIRENYASLSEDEPRFRYRDRLAWIGDVANEILAQEAARKRAAPRARKELADAWAGRATKRRDEIGKDVESLGKSKMPARVAVGFIASPILSLFLERFGESMWAVLERVSA